MKRQPFSLRIYLCVLLCIVMIPFAQANIGGMDKHSTAGDAPLPSNSVTNLTICNNQLPYTWNSITCLTAGTYSATLTGSNGTDSIAVLNLSVINVGISITNAIICDNQLPYSWNGHTYTASGTYSVTLTSSGGCDSVPILSLTVNNFVTSSTSKTVCSNQLPYNWNGNSYTTAGTYSVTLRSAAGCDSIASLILTVKPVASSNTTATVCSNQLPYIWNGRTYNVAGSYQVTLAASNGCDSVAKLVLKVNPAASSITQLTICDNQFPYTWNGRSCGGAGLYAVILRSYLDCDSVANLVLFARPVKTSTTAVTICTSQLPYTWNGQIYPAAGTYAVTLTGSNGCDSVAKLQLSTAAFLTSTTDQAICNSELPYSWNGNSYATAGTYTASFVNANGCDSIATLNLRVINPSVKTDSLLICADLLPYNYHGHIFTAPGDYEIIPPVVLDPCHTVDSVNLKIHVIPPGTSIIKRCSNQLPYFWNSQPYSLPGYYSITLTSAAGCDSTANLDLSVNSVYNIDTSINICSNRTPFLWNGNAYSSSGTYVSRLLSSGGCDSIVTLHLAVNPVQTSITAIAICNAQVPFTWNGNTYSTSGNYNVTLTSSAGCDSIATLHLFVQPFLTSNTTITVCDNQLPFHWNGNTYPAAGTYSVTLMSSGGCDSLATLNLVINNVITSITDINTCTNQLPYVWNGNTYTTAGTYSVTLITNGGCDSVATLRLHVGSPLTSTTQITICNNQLPFTWNGNTYPIAGTYPVTLTSSSGCDSVATLQLTVKAILTSTTNVNVCNNQLPYLWSGNSYNTGGTYSVTMTTVAGCDSVPILSLTVVPYVTSTTDLTICNNQLPFIWNRDTFTTAGSYAVLLTGFSVCDSLATLNLTVRAPITSTTNISVCPSQLPYNWNGRLYTTAGTYTSTITNSIGCDSTATLNLSVRSVATSITNKRICNNQLPFTWNGRSYSATGSYTATLPGSNGCDSFATLNLIVNPVTRSNTQRVVCFNQLPYSWNGNSYASAGNYSVTLTNSEGCDSVANLQLVVIPVATSNTIIRKCSNELPYTWNGHSYAAAGTYRDTLRSSAGCDSIASLQLIVNAVTNSNTDTSICSTVLPFSWNGQLYNTAGTYSVTLTNGSGCDSTATLNLLVRSVATSISIKRICNNQLPFTWNGQNYSVTGSYTVTLTGSNGCDSVATLNLIVNPVSRSNTQRTICISQLPYNWNGSNYSAAGNYTVTLTGSEGCDSVATLQLVVIPVATSNIIVRKCSNQLPYNWNGHSYTAAGTYRDTLLGSAGCDSIATLQLVVNAVTNSNTDTSICSTVLPFSWNGQLYNTAGTYSVTLTNSSGCDSVASLRLVVHAVSAGSSTASTCANQLPYRWNGQQYTASGNYTVILTNAAGCDSVVQLKLTVFPVSASTSTATTCSDQLPYIWNGQNYNATGLYVITLTSAAGCDSIATLDLTVHPTPLLPIVSPLTYCQFDPVAALSATSSPGSQLVWYTAATGGSGSLTAPVPSASIAGITNYYVAQYNGFCEGARIPLTVTINSKPALGPDKQIKLCFADSLDLSGLYNVSGLSSQWTFGPQVLSGTTVGIAGNYQLAVKNNQGCADTAIVQLTILPKLFAYAGRDADAEYNAPYQLNGDGNGQFEWLPHQFLSNPFIANPTALLTSDQAFVLLVKNELGCTATDTVKLRVLKGPTFYVPSAFTPNGDTNNDIFRPTPIGIASLEYFRVFNRYGEMVYETSRLYEGWNGIYKGVKQNPGNYVWMLKGTDRFGKLKLMKGNVVLIR